jgi:GDPmannose 4,6-dehydratase|tara:strand:+ start:2794 stop:3765 length:972 start_codon:yes stop_codon:yes gene_type:complete
MRRALVTGITGQDGSFLAEFLLEKNYEVHGIIRRSSSFNTGRINHIFDKLHLYYADVTDASRIAHLIKDIHPDEIYSLAAQSHVRVSFDEPMNTAQIDAMGVLNILDCIKDTDIKMYQASSSEIFGSTKPPHNEKSKFRPQSPYACSKVFAHFLTDNYRDAYNVFACCGILFNHESERRGETFVTRKITRAATRIKVGLQDKLVLGNLSAKRDWGYAKDYVKAMWMMLQYDKPDDYVVAIGKSYSVKEFLDAVFNYLNLDWEKYVQFDERYFRPTEVDHLLGDATKIKETLGWEPTVGFDELVRIMVDADLKLAGNERMLENA